MKPLAALAALLIAAGSTSLPAFARSSFVIDNASLLSPAAVTQINTKIADFNAQTHKEVVVDTEPALVGATIDAMAERTFAQHQINGVLILITTKPKLISVSVDRASARFFPAGSTGAIRTAIVSSFKNSDFDGGVNNGVDLSLSQFRSHLGSLRTTNSVPVGAGSTVRNETGGGFNMSWIFWLIALAVIFFIVRGIFRAMAGPRVMPPGYGPGMGGPGYGPGYGGGGFGGGGGGFFSGLLGGLGGAFLGNELFGNHNNQGFNGDNQAGMTNVNNVDGGGWQNDGGQIDQGASSSGGWGDSGGDSGGGGGWGGGDSGGGGGGGDSGGGW